KKPEKKAKKPNFLTEVRAEMKRVTWPTKADVLRWSGVVVVALLFFGIYVSVLDNLVVVPALMAISGLGA
ncbi:MAG: preprotein translocase subunit SecE, partial [Raoultibacter sp.]